LIFMSYLTLLMTKSRGTIKRFRVKGKPVLFSLSVSLAY
jgi:hypothetical protein